MLKNSNFQTFSEQLKFVDKATSVQWDSVQTDMKELAAGFKMAEKEQELKGTDCPEALSTFTASRKQKMEDLEQAFQLAASSFKDCCEFYGENEKSTSPTVFFQKLAHFVQNYQKCRGENEAKAALEKVRDAFFCRGKSKKSQNLKEIREKTMKNRIFRWKKWKKWRNSGRKPHKKVGFLLEKSEKS